MDLMELGKQLLGSVQGGGADGDAMGSALSQLLGDGQGGIDIAGLVNKMNQNGELGSMVSSWLGDGANEAISADKISALVGDGALADFAKSLGVDTSTAADNLANVLPQMVDKSSSGGSLLDAVGGMDGLMNAAKSFLGK
jgi:uncharacterized protein YidB (DUF937 family)